MEASLATPTRPNALGRVNPDVCEALAWLSSPNHIQGEIAFLEGAIAAGDTSPETACQLSDWRTIRQAQRALVLAQGEGDE